MLLSENTLTVLKNYATIRTGILFREGNVIRTINEGKTILSAATIDEHIPSEFGISDLSQFLSLISLHKSSPNLTIRGNNVLIEGGRSLITYRWCAAEMIKGAPTNKEIVLPSNDISFILTEDDFNWVMRASSVLKSANIAVVGEGGKVFIKTYDATNDSEPFDTLEVATYTGSDAFFLFRTENWKMIPGSYTITISSQGISSFESQTRKITYWIALESKAKK